MSSAWVIDSSVGFAWIHPAQATSTTNLLLEEVEKGAAIVVPSFWFLEIANGLLVLERRKKLTPEERRIALDTLSRLVFIVDEEGRQCAFSTTSQLAEKYNLSVYDAAYLELSIRRKLPLASRDAAVNAAAKKAGVRILD